MACCSRVLVGGFRALFAGAARAGARRRASAYLETAIDEKMRAGMSREEAMRAARVEIGSLEAVKDHVRDVGWESRVESVWQDVRYASRTLRRRRALPPSRSSRWRSASAPTRRSSASSTAFCSGRCR